jgi:hypothetical protein
MKPLFTVTALIEAGAGLALGCFPSTVVALLPGSGLDTPAAVTQFSKPKTQTHPQL